jgi:hypothetical protein
MPVVLSTRFGGRKDFEMLRLGVLFSLAFAFIAFSACSRERAEITDPGLGTTTAATALDAQVTETNPASPASPAGTAVVPEVESGVPVAVTLQDNTLGIQTSIPPGPVVFTVQNSGTQQHSLAIEGENVSRQLDPKLDAGQSGSMEITLVAGQTYRVYCPVLDHATKGEQVDVQVTR